MTWWRDDVIHHRHRRTAVLEGAPYILLRWAHANVKLLYSGLNAMIQTPGLCSAIRTSCDITAWRHGIMWHYKMMSNRQKDFKMPAAGGAWTPGCFIWSWYHKVCFTFLFSSIMAVDILIDLPPELRANILETLDVCSACKACCVSNKWSDAIENCTPLWRKLCYAHCTKEDIERDSNAGYSWKVLSQTGLCGYLSLCS